MEKINEIFQNATFWNWIALCSIIIALIWFPLNSINFYFNTIPKIKDWYAIKKKSRFEKRLNKEFQKIIEAIEFISLPTNVAISRISHSILKNLLQVFMSLFFLIFITIFVLKNSILELSLGVTNLFITIIGGNNERVERSSETLMTIYFAFLFFTTILFFLQPLEQFWNVSNIKKKIAEYNQFLKDGVKKGFIEENDSRISELIKLVKTSSIYEAEIKQLEDLQTAKSIETNDEAQELVAKKQTKK